MFIKKDLIKSKIIKNIINRGKKYGESISSPEYISWRNDLLSRYYNGYFTNVFNQKFPVYIYYGNPYLYPFKNLFNEKQLLNDKRKIDLTQIPYYKKYKKLQENKWLDIKDRRVRHPKRKCFMLDKIVFNNNKIETFTAFIGRYEDNVYSSLILEYETYLLFNNCFYGNKGKNIITNELYKNKNENENKECYTLWYK